MRQPSAGTVVLVQLRTGRGDRLHDPFLSCVQLDTATRQQPGPPPPEQPAPSNLSSTGEDHGPRAAPPTPQTDPNSAGPRRRRAARVAREYATASSALPRAPDDPQRPHGTLRATVEQQALRQRHPVTVIGRFAWKNSTRDTQSATGQALVVDGGDQALEIGLEAVGEPIWIALRRASTAIDGGRVSPVGISASSTSTGMIWTPCAIAVSVPSQMKSPGSSMRWRRRLSVMLSHLGR